MSRGGGRGGFGRGGARGGRAGASNMPPMGLSFQELGTLDKTPSKLFPEIGTVPRMDNPDEKEIRYATYQLHYLQDQKTSPYWPVLEQRRQSDLARFTDRYRPESHDLPSLRSVHMQKEVFPKRLWDTFMEGETKREELKAKLKRRRKINWESIDLEDRQGGNNEDHIEGSSEPEDLGDYEDEDDDDYNEHYFDNGEDDDLGDDEGTEAIYD